MRLRLIAHAMWMMERGGTSGGHVAAHVLLDKAAVREVLRGIMDLLLEFDPMLLGMFHR